MLSVLTGSRLRAKVLQQLFGHPGRSYYVRELAGAIGQDSTNVSRELARLERNGVVVSIGQGKRKYYKANPDFPAFEQLKDLSAERQAPPGRLSDTNSMPASRRFNVPARQLAEFSRKHHIRRLALFGSVLREDFRPDSDIDVLVEFEPGHVPGFGIVDIENELSQMAGRKVDLRTPGDLSRYFRDRVMREAEVRYAA